MALHPQARRGVLAVAAGLALLALVATVGGFHLDDDVYRYDLARVTYEDDRYLTVRDSDTGKRLHGIDPAHDVVCDGRFTSRSCQFERALNDSDVSVPGSPSPSSDYRWVLLDRFYRVGSEDTDDGWRLSLTPVPAEEALSKAAVDYADSSRAVKRVVRSGRAVTYRRILPERQFVERDGEYYRVYLSGFRDFGPDAAWSGGRCYQRGDDFCESADLRRTGITALTLAALVGGALAVAYGVREYATHPVDG